MYKITADFLGFFLSLISHMWFYVWLFVEVWRPGGIYAGAQVVTIAFEVVAVSIWFAGRFGRVFGTRPYGG